MRNVLIATLLAGCAGSANYWVDYAPMRGTTTQSKEAATQRAVVAITDAGREIESSDAATGIVLSRWFSGDGFGGDQTRFRVRVTFADGSYEVAVLCQRQNAATPGWNDDCDPNKRPRFAVETAAKVEAALR